MPSPPHNVESVIETLRTRYWSWVVLGHSDGPRHLVALLTQNLPHIDANSWQERLDFGGVYVNGREMVADAELPIPCKVEYYEPKFDISRASEVFPKFLDDFVVYRDDHLIAVYKPPGLSSMPAKEQRHFSVKASVERLTAATVHMPSRLDVSAQGLILMSYSSEAHARLQQSFESRRVQKEYRCASAATCEWKHKRVDAPIGRDPIHPVLRQVDNTRGKSAITEFSLLRESTSENTRVSVFRASPITGRTHQIRVHAAAFGIPLLGDRFYGGPPAKNLHLVSYSLSLMHPVTNKTLAITLPERLLPAWILECPAQS